MRKEVNFIGKCKFTEWRIAGLPAQALSQESGQERSFEHRPSQTLVRFQERTAPHGKEEGNPPDQTANIYERD
jgi:hypothetical protein